MSFQHDQLNARAEACTFVVGTEVGKMTLRLLSFPHSIQVFAIALSTCKVVENAQLRVALAQHLIRDGGHLHEFVVTYFSRSS